MTGKLARSLLQHFDLCHKDPREPIFIFMRKMLEK